eukprot:scaffold5543_cov119-Isochrysis_galbana.AAC.4
MTISSRSSSGFGRGVSVNVKDPPPRWTESSPAISCLIALESSLDGGDTGNKTGRVWPRTSCVWPPT